MLGAPLLLATPALASDTGLSDDVASYVGLGEHRAGTVGERKTIRWLDRRLAQLGYATERQKFAVQTLLDPGGQLVVGGTKTLLFPQWLPPATALGRDIRAPLAALDAPTGPPSIRIVTSPVRLSANWIQPFDALVAEAIGKGGKALIISINDPSDDLFVCNQHHPGTFPIPVMLMARRNLAKATTAVGALAEMRVAGTLTNTHARNIFGRKAGVGPMIVISTPLTGWFHCGGERGPGIALWLRMAALLARQSRPVLMLGTGSHEIGHLGMEHALKHGAPSPDQVQPPARPSRSATPAGVER